MRVFLFISNTGKSISIAERVKQEGHRVLFYINDERYRKIGDGLVDKHKCKEQLFNENGSTFMGVLEKLLYPKPDCVVIDEAVIGLGVVADVLRERAIPVFGGGRWADQLMDNKAFQNKMFKVLGIYHRAGMELIDTMNTNILFTGESVISITHSVRELELMDGRRGPKAMMGITTWTGNESSRLYKEGIGKILPLLRKVGFIGFISLRTQIEDDMLEGIEINTTLDNSISPFLEMYKGKVNDLLYGIAANAIRKVYFKSNIAIGVVLAIPPYPYNISYNGNVVINGLDKNNLKHFWGYDVHREKDSYLSSSCGGQIGMVTARGDEVLNYSPLRDARRRVMRTINNIHVEDQMYRLDIGGRVEGDRDKLKRGGWL